MRNSARRVRHRLTGNLIQGPRTLADNIRHFANPGPEFESANTQAVDQLASRARTIAFYLPQFHAFDENDAWWGDGFTEWRNVARGTPRFAGHYQPRIPRDLGFYDLSHTDTIRAQSELAKRNGIDAFCFYYYWFNGKRLMEKPLDLLLASDIDQPFCIMWANENWTRTWDGFDSDVLIHQDYLDDDEDAFIADTARYMADSRYVCIDEQPLFILYRPGLLPDAKNTLQRWRDKWTAVLGVTPLVMMVQGFGDEDPRDFGLDGAVEFPPHKVCVDAPNITGRCRLLDKKFKGLVRDYKDVIVNSLSESPPPFPLIKTVSPSWDNDARRQGAGMAIHGSSPALYERWLTGAIDFANENPVQGESLVFINAWNEWAEGAYLEPDVHYGHAYLNATKRAVKGLPSLDDADTLLLVGHDAYKHGAQMLLINIAKTYQQQLGMKVVIALKSGGPLLSEYQRIAPTQVLGANANRQLQKLVMQHDIKTAICNTSVTGNLVPVLRRAGVKVVSLIHEMPNLIREYALESCIKDIGHRANHVVFPAQTVLDGFTQFCDEISANIHIRPQGTYMPVEFNAEKRAALRQELGVNDTDKLVLGVGYADLRKGFDLFMDAARRMCAADSSVHFVWAGALSGDMQRWIEFDLQDRELAKQIHLPGFTTNVADYYSAADCLYLPSREDPYPTVVLEAMNVGMPVVLYRGMTGFDSLMQQHGFLVSLGDSQAVDEALVQALNENDLAKREARVKHVVEACRFEDYCADLVAMLHTENVVIELQEQGEVQEMDKAA
jgi:glycosyltransferase involved in cell wall biosynthesis